MKKPENVTTARWLQYNTLFFIEHFLGRKNFLALFGGIERRMFKAIDEHAAKCPPNSSFHVIEQKKGEWKEPFYHPHLPKIFRGAAAYWPCMGKWDFDFFANEYGDREVSLISNVGLRGENSSKLEKIKLRDYVREMRSGSKRYVKFDQMINEHSALQDDFDGTWLAKFQMSGEFRRHFFLFMGGKSTTTPIHNGIQPTVFVQLVGEKKWVFFPTTDRIFMGVRPERRSYYYTPANPYNLNDPAYPLLKYCAPIEVTIYPGDVLFFPPHVWHQVENATDSIGVAYKFFHLPSSFTSSKMLSTLFLLATKPYLIQASILSRRNKSVYMFDKPED
jgi:hypothetical protein